MNRENRTRVVRVSSANFVKMNRLARFGAVGFVMATIVFWLRSWSGKISKNRLAQFRVGASLDKQTSGSVQSLENNKWTEIRRAQSREQIGQIIGWLDSESSQHSGSYGRLLEKHYS